MWPAERSIYTVGELTTAIKAHIEEGFGRVSVSGEISNFKRHSSGHLYLTLKDSKAQLNAVCWRTTAERLRVEPSDGKRVVVTGRLTVFEPYGRYQIVIDTIEDAGEGPLQLAFLKLKARLESEGLFDAEHKRPLPEIPRCVAVITSRTGAAIRDILSTLERRWPAVNVVVVPVRVQGDLAPGEIVRALEMLARTKEVDLIICGRGGGSLEDLWAFNEETVARAVFASPIPVISAVGHETDFTIADFVADARAATPTMAAEMAVPERADVRRRVDGLVARATRDATTLIELRKRRLSEQLRSYALGQIRGRIERGMQTLDHASDRAHAAARRTLERRGVRLEASQTRLAALDPTAVLSRGYAICADAGTGRVVRDADDAVATARLHVTFADGVVLTDVREKVS